MSRGAAVVPLIAAACFWAHPAAAQVPPATWQAARHAPGILGTLDPKTGKFTPDAPPAAPSNLSGTLNIGFQLDTAHLSSTSVICLATILYAIAEAPERFHRNDPDAFNLDYEKKSKKLVGSLPVPFAIPVPESVKIIATVGVECRYTFDARTPIYYSIYRLELHSGDNFLSIGGLMDGASF